MSNLETMDAQWRCYSERVIPVGAGETQRMECRLAFYAGAVSLMDIFLLFTKADNPSHEDYKKLEKVADELVTFWESGGKIDHE